MLVIILVALAAIGCDILVFSPMPAQIVTLAGPVGPGRQQSEFTFIGGGREILTVLPNYNCGSLGGLGAN